MYKKTLLFLINLAVAQLCSQTLPVQYEELTAVQFPQAVLDAKKTCIIPIGILEKHGPHLPLGTDLLDSREISLRAAKQEYSVVFPPYYFGQIYEAKHQPGTIAYSPELVWNILQETCDELARNGFGKIILVNGHGGNNHFLHYFCQAQLAEQKNYALYLFEPQPDAEDTDSIKKLRKTSFGGHADESETAMMLSHRPELVHLDQADKQSGADQQRLSALENSYTAIWWYARFPNHYAGEAKLAVKELGEQIMHFQTQQLLTMIRSVKADEKTLQLQNQFFQESQKPLETKQ